MRDVYVSEVGLAKFGKRDLTLEELALEAVSDMGAHEGLENIDAIFFGNMSAEEFVGISNVSTWVADHLGLSGKPSIRIETGSSSGAAAFQAGFRGISSGCFDRVLVLASEKMTHVPTNQTTKILAEVLDPVERSYGATMTALAALATRRYMHEYGLTLEELAYVPVKNHENGSLNPYAHFQKPITLEKVMNSKIIASPLRLFDCSPISDGAAAMILTSNSNPIWVTGIGQGTEHVALQHRDFLTSFTATRRAAKRAYSMANRKPSDIEIAEVHDAFTSFEIIDSEDLGFFNPGHGKTALVSGITKLNGDLPINPSGGLKARGHPVGVSGLAQVVEIVWQLLGKAGKRTVRDVKVGLTQSIGGFASNNFVNILEVA